MVVPCLGMLMKNNDRTSKEMPPRSPTHDRLDPRFMKSSAQLEAERIAEQEAKEHRSGLSQSREAREAGRNGQAGQVGQAGEASSSRRGPGRRQRRHAKEELAGEVSRFWGPDGQYNPYGQFFPAPPAPPRKPGFWLWRQSEEASKMSSPDPQYFVTDWVFDSDETHQQHELQRLGGWSCRDRAEGGGKCLEVAPATTFASMTWRGLPQ
ncbi:unnamed protein product [Durusdinium trenchii]|uniref:Uncharacterized protein n=1 Tax=Durusdinium trenchii TaxID=1381693 RepID=A0ABP0IE11_9DINO